MFPAGRRQADATVGNQLSAKGLSWKEYAQDMGNDPKRDGTVQTGQGPGLRPPAAGGTDYTDSTGPKNDSYATRHNGFMYFESIIGNKALCDTHVVSLTPLAKDLESVSTTPNYSFITPNTCSTATTGRSARTGPRAAYRRSRCS